MNKQHVTLSDPDRTQLEALLAKGTLPVRQFKRATALLELARGKTLQAVATTLGVAYNTIALWRDKYKEQGLACLQEAPRAGRPIVFDGTQRAQITALAVAARLPDAPRGAYACWPTRSSSWAIAIRFRIRTWATS